jgi:hypothetical protein
MWQIRPSMFQELATAIWGTLENCEATMLSLSYPPFLREITISYDAASIVDATLVKGAEGLGHL